MATPAELAQDERVADVLMAMEGQRIETIRAAPLVVLSGDLEPRGVVGLHAAGLHFGLTVQEARCVAIAVRAEDPSPNAQALAYAIDVGATMTELLEVRARCRILRQRLEAIAP